MKPKGKVISMAEEAAKSIVDELGDMITGYEEGKDKDEKPADEGAKDTDGDDSGDSDDTVGDDLDGGDDGGDDVDDAGKEGGEGEEEDGEETDESDERIAELNAKVVQLEAMITANAPAKPAEEKTDVSVKHDTIDFVGEDSVVDIVDSKDGLNKLANEILKQAADLVNKGVEKTLLAVPTLAIRQMNNASKLNKIVSGFYEANEDLVKYKGVVGAMINKVTSENPDYDIDKVLKEAAKESRKALNLKEKAVSGKKTKSKSNPAFSKQSGKRTAGVKKPKITGIQKEIDDLL